ncbi:4-hydroxy-2-oxovalerate aldolase [Streptomyces violaceusniger]|uniref:4-hydroxy-2-oxovalerate aldolase n=2 Tax=Streptomyces violaceusniger group TaxID=2839105 RepID=A0ABD5J550_9ACTN|nr:MULTISPECIES: 4-hydroxy-2-oxovalerate aldolase [Streptomyces]MEE4583084.1 4-hydroxy-2-oxovalerate aldolase [Streptomyces sp. DSM 41602]KUL47312.1 4-hydroxy-2-oxovalerate aldolase [Streptomyces violaceusniger]QTI88019.1 4-hydroxy-2-oxovalerate aldolase [Streptomyces sp. AgN23]RSS45156.1 4-hydroxy-2-oxovalerate aldolase [Streptomyces sp. WAC05858]WTA80295.1 4-hydroxy-2-oxovalerate aldolase [Streptomyces antimycoticus]
MIRTADRESGARKPVLVHDPTLRDGHHAVRHNLGPDQLRGYAAAADAAGIPVVEVGHGNGLGASSLQAGQARLGDDEMLSVVREALPNSRMGVFMIPGWGTVQDLKKAIAHDVDVVRIGTHCTEGDLAERHLGFLRDAGVEAHGVLLMSHMASPRQLAEECARLVEYGASGVGILDSSGHFLPADVAERIGAIRHAVDVPVMFHGHNNLGMAVANSVAAVEAGASIVDACARGFGAGAGNTQLEVLVPVLERMGFATGIDLYGLLDAADIAGRELMPAPPAIDSVGVVSGLSGVFSGFKNRVLDISRREGVDPRDVFFELGERQAVAGQEDLIVDVALALREETHSGRPAGGSRASGQE